MDLKDAKILVCDDSLLERRRMKNLLYSYGVANVYEAADGESAIKEYIDKKPDVVFMDIVMPKKNGVEALEAIMEFDSKAKIVMASSVGTKGYINDAVKLGAIDFIQKPLEEQQVSEALERVLGGK